jgi:osmotically-inducible protein OsmY
MRKRGIQLGAADFPAPEEPMATTAMLSSPHQIEEDVQRELLGHGGLHFSSLVVRRVPNGVCLEGVLETDDASEASSSVCGLARRVAGVQKVLNHLLVRCPQNRPAAKG